MTPKISILFINDVPERLAYEYSLKPTATFWGDEGARLLCSYDRDIEEKCNIRDGIARHLEESGFDVKTPAFALDKLSSSKYISKLSLMECPKEFALALDKLSSPKKISEISFNLALQYSPNLILCDLWSFFNDGLRLCEQLRRDERTSNIPILMITPFKPEFVKDRVSKLPFFLGDDFVAKPLDLEELDVCLNTLLLRY